LPFRLPASSSSSCELGRAPRRPPASGHGGRLAGAELSAVAVSGLRKRYGAHEALRGIDFAVDAGEVFGLLGPNGAGKTTTVEILEGFRARDGGTVEVLGEDPEHAGRHWKERVGVVLQSSSLYPNLTVRESLSVFGGYFQQPRDPREVIEIIGLTEKANARCRTLSGGQKRRLDLGLALVGNPDLLFLDEPTTGFDPGARRAAWETIRNLRSLGTTILLTTHYLDEAEQLADRVAVLREGVIVRVGSPAELIAGDAETEIRFRRDGETIIEQTTEPTRRLHELTAAALERGEELEALEVRRPTLEEVYLELTGD
jgi:ABC-2 type transport system ATP-binding protein